MGHSSEGRPLRGDCSGLGLGVSDLALDLLLANLSPSLVLTGGHYGWKFSPSFILCTHSYSCLANLELLPPLCLTLLFPPQIRFCGDGSEHSLSRVSEICTRLCLCFGLISGLRRCFPTALNN